MLLALLILTLTLPQRVTFAHLECIPLGSLRKNSPSIRRRAVLDRVRACVTNGCDVSSLPSAGVASFAGPYTETLLAMETSFDSSSFGVTMHVTTGSSLGQGAGLLLLFVFFGQATYYRSRAYEFCPRRIRALAYLRLSSQTAWIQPSPGMEVASISIVVLLTAHQVPSVSK